MSLDEEFCDSPYQFMKTHVVRVVLSNQFQKPITNEVTAFVVESPYAPAIDNAPRPNSKVCHLHLVEDPGAPPAPKYTRKVYWCHYDKNDSHSTILGRKHAYMFTPQMDGCSFGAGALSSDGAATVVHSNAVDFGSQHLNDVNGVVGALKMQAHKQTEMLDQTFSQANKSLGRIISPFSYMSENGGIEFRMKATIFGRRNTDNQWKFYSHVYRTLGMKYIHCGVNKYARTLT